MPELPEVEKMCQKVHDWTLAGTIKDFEVLRGGYLKLGTPAMRDLRVIGKTFCGVFRAGKYMVFVLEKGYIICHNAMSGYWDTSLEPWTFDYVEGKRQATQHDVRVKITVDSPKFGIFSLQFHDARLFGSLAYHDVEHESNLPFMKRMGRDALETPRLLVTNPQITVEEFLEGIKKPKPIKELIMRQDIIAGIGNIYSVEALWRAGIHPATPGDQIGNQDAEALLGSIWCVLNEALANDLDYSQYLYVYRQKNCYACKEKIQKIDIAKRSTYFCVHCQR